MVKQRRLSDLYVVGKTFEFDDGADDPVIVYIRKLSPVDNETALRKSNAARAKILTCRHDHDSPEYQAIYGQVYDIGTQDELINYLVMPESAKRVKVIEAELADEKEWKDHDYLQGLRDAWEGGLKESYESDPDDPEAVRVHDELDRFSQSVQKVLEGEQEAMRRGHAQEHIDDLRVKVLDQLIEMQADLSWMNEYRKCEVWLSCRDNSNRKQKYFTSREEVDELALEIFQQLQEAYRSISVDVLEGKDSAATPVSSPQPGVQEVQATDGFSGPLDAPQ